MVFQVLYLILYAVYSYVHLVYRKIVPRSPKSIDGDIFLITGSASGIGKAVVQYLAKHHPKTKLVLWDWDEVENRETAEGAKLLGVQAYHYKVDVTDRRQVDATAKRVLDDVGQVTILFNNAGVATMSDVLSAAPEKIEKTVTINLLSHFWTIKAFLPGMIDVNRGHIVTTASGSSYVPLRGDAPYSASKFGIRGYIEGLRSELRHHPLQPKIEFTTIFPSFIDTNMTKGVKLETKFVSSKFMDVKYVAAEIVDAVCRNEEKLFLPRHTEILTFCMNFIPAPLLRKIEDYVVVSIELPKQ